MMTTISAINATSCIPGKKKKNFLTSPDPILGNPRAIRLAMLWGYRECRIQNHVR